MNSGTKSDARNKAYRCYKENCKTLQRKCQLCGKEQDVQFHHENYNTPLIVTMLCVDCHKKYHNGEISIPNPINLEDYANGDVSKYKSSENVDKLKVCNIRLKISAEEKRQIQKQAQTKGLSNSAYLRLLALEDGKKGEK